MQRANKLYYEDHTFSSTDETVSNSRPVVYREYLILNFVRSVWNFTPSMIPACNYNIPMEYVKGYCQARPDDNRHRKRESCIWLSKILDHLHNALPDNPSNEARFINVADRVVVNGYPNLKPDFLRSEKEDLDNEQNWEDMTGFAEVKHGCKQDLPPGQDGPTLEINLSYLSDKEQAVEVYEEPASPTIPAKRKRVNTPAPGSTKSNKRRKNQDSSATSRESTHYSTPAMSGEDFDLAVGESKEEQDEEVGRLSEGLALDTTPPSPLPGPTTSLDVSDVKEKAHTDNISQNMRFRTGTGPFMAIDVLDLTPTPIHIYRCDLESFFYVLVWFCAGFNPEMNTLSSIDDWRTPPFKTIAANKRSFVNTNETRNAILAPTHSTYKPIIDLWISPLRKIFQGIESTTLSISQKKGEVMDLDDKFQQGLAMLDQLTLEAKEALLVTKTEIKELEAEVQHLEAERDDLCTYDKFMVILHDKPRTVSELRDDANRDITEDELDMMLLKLRSELESEKDEA
ncbi:hypothetical protein ABKN59_009234 [Abortiporus biennis]